MPGPSRMRGQRTRTLRCGPCDRRRERHPHRHHPSIGSPLGTLMRC
jgi:hypothetical protein